MGRKKAKQPRVRLPEKIQSFIYQARYGRSLNYDEIVEEAQKKFPNNKKDLTRARCQAVVGRIRQKMRKNGKKKVIRTTGLKTAQSKESKTMTLNITGKNGAVFTDKISFKTAKKIIMDLVSEKM